MLGRLISNTFFNVLSFVTVSAVGILLVPFILGQWGLESLGLIMLARTILPSGLGAIFDVGLSDLVTHAIARWRANSDMKQLSRELAVLFSMAVGSGLVVGAALYLAAPYLAILLQAGVSHEAQFVEVLRVTALSLLVLFPTLALEGILKGHERYTLLRLCDVGSVLFYAAATLAAGYYDQGYEAVVYAHLASQLLRSLMISIYAAGLWRSSRIVLSRPRTSDVSVVTRRSWLMIQSKLISVFGQGTVFPFIISAFFGPAATGLYDLIVRLPRFARSSISYAMSALLPFATRVDQAGSVLPPSRMVRAGMILWPWVTVPPLVASALLSEQVLRVWVGPEYSPYGFWMGIMFVPAMTLQYLIVPNSFTINRPELFQRYNLMMLASLVVTVSFSFGTLFWLEGMAFIAGQALGAAVMLPFVIKLYSGAFELEWRPLFRVIAMFWLIVAALGAGLLPLRDWLFGMSVVELAFVAAVWCALVWSITWFLALTSADRSEALLLARAANPLKRRRQAT